MNLPNELLDALLEVGRDPSGLEAFERLPATKAPFGGFNIEWFDPIDPDDLTCLAIVRDAMGSWKEIL